jgi:hypothetical protein
MMNINRMHSEKIFRENFKAELSIIDEFFYQRLPASPCFFDAQAVLVHPAQGLSFPVLDR